MATLTETAYFTRKTVNIGVIIVALVIAARIVIGGATGLWQRFFPPPPPPPTMAFGKLPAPAAQSTIATPSGAISYTLETVDGSVPVLPPMARVYFMPKISASFGSFDRMKTQAVKLGFTDIPVRAGPTTWQYTDKDKPLRALTIDEVSGNFRLVYNYLSDLAVFNDKNFSSNEQVIADGRSFFDGLEILSEDFKGGQPLVSYYRFDSGALVPTTSLANADAVGVTLARTDLDSGSILGKIPVVSPDFRQGLVSVLLSGSGDPKKKIIEARFLATAVDLQNWATYPLAKAEELWGKLQSGQAIFASLPSSLPSKVTVRKIYLAYLDPYPAQSYLQPVLVFSDEKGFVAYVPAVAN